jgi:hypothetical protein
VPHAVGSDHRVNILGIIALRSCSNHSEKDYREKEFFHCGDDFRRQR